MTFTPRSALPDPAKDPAGFARALLEIQRAIAAELSRLAKKPFITPPISTNIVAREYAWVRCLPPAAGMVVMLPEPRAANATAYIALLVDNVATGGTVTVCAVNGLVNGQAFITLTAEGLTIFYSNGTDRWNSQMELPPESPGGSALDAEYVLGVAHASLPNGRVATDSTEVDAVLTTPNVISWALNVASVAFSKLANLTGLSVLGRAASSSGVMAAITATAANQRLVSDGTATTLAWVSDLPTTYSDTVTGTQTDYVLPNGFRSGDTLRLTITGNVTLNSIVFFGSVQPSEGFEMNLCLSDQSGGAAPGFFITIPDGGTSAHSAAFRTPGQVQGTVPGPDYVMRSEEEGARLAYQTSAWRIISGTAAQAIDGDITVAAGNGSTRTAAITAGVIVNGDINAGAAIALSKLATQNANTVVANATAGSAVPTAVAVGTNTVLGRVAGNIVAAALVNAQVDAAAAIALSKLATQAADSFVGNFTSGVAVPTARAGTSVAGAGLTYTTGGTLAIVAGAGASLVVGTDDVQRGALTGDVTAAQDSNATTLANAVVTPAKLAVIASNIGAVFTIFVTVTAGTPGSADDVTIYSSNAPFAFRILDVTWLDSTAIALSTVQLRDTSGGGGAALSSALTAAVTGTARNNDTQTRTVAANSSVFLRRSDQGVAGDLVILAVRT